MSEPDLKIRALLDRMNQLIGDAVGLGYCSGCGDALVWNYEASAGLCYRCQDEEPTDD